MSNQIIPGCCSAGWEHVHCAWVNEFKYLVKHTNKKEIHKKGKEEEKKRAIDRKKKKMKEARVMWYPRYITLLSSKSEGISRNG